MDDAARELERGDGRGLWMPGAAAHVQHAGRDPRRRVITCAYLALVEKSEITVKREMTQRRQSGFR